VPVTLTLAGIAGFVLSIGMAVDANILIFERTKEELRVGKGIVPAVEAGFSRAWNSILDSNVSSLITAFILFYFGSSTIKGFALVLIIGVLCSMFTAITVTRIILRAVISRPRFASPYLYGVAKGDLEATEAARG
jgi:preprotein translocase subunit SecD